MREAGAVADDAELRKTEIFQPHILSLLCPAHSGVIGGVWEGGSVLFEGVRAACENVIRRPFGTTTFGAVNLSGCIYKAGMLLQCWGALG